MLFEGLEFETMKREDIPELTQIMKRSFDEDSRLFFNNPVGGPPGYDDGSFLEKWGMSNDSTAYKISLDGKAIGALILFLHPQKKFGFLGTIFVDSNLCGKGYGYKMWKFVEAQNPEIKYWETETPAVSYRNHRFYINKCGFQVYEVEGGEDRFDAQFKLRKIIN